MNVEISKSNKKDKTLMAVIDGKKTIHVGAAGYEDMTTHQDKDRKARYIRRHSNEHHSKSNIASPAFMSRCILWNKPTLQSSVNDLNKKYKDVSFKLKV